MPFAKRLALASMLVLAAAGGALAGEDSTDRYEGFGSAFWQTSCGLPCFNAAQPDFPPASAQP